MKGLLVLSHHVEDGEALFTLALLRRIGFNVHTMTFQETKEIHTAYGQTTYADFKHSEINVLDYDFLVIPGGKYVSEIIDQGHQIMDLASLFNDHHKWVCAICAGPRFLGRAGLLDNRSYTCYPGSEVDMPKGIYLQDEKVVVDSNIITARSAGAVYEFVHAITKKLLGEQKAQQLYASILY
ncbi:MAG: DJ-1/PfpI family protein [Acholeplasmataceae bacterium]